MLILPPFIWAAWYITRLLFKFTPKGVVFSFVQLIIHAKDSGLTPLGPLFLFLVAAFKALKATVSGCFWVQRLPL